MRTIEEIKADIEKAKKSHELCLANKCVGKSCRKCSFYKTCGQLDNFIEEFNEAILKDVSLDRLEEICNAEHDGRLVVLPCPIGTPIYVIGSECQNCRDTYEETYCEACSSRYCLIESVFLLRSLEEFGKNIFFKDQKELAKQTMQKMEDEAIISTKKYFKESK